MPILQELTVIFVLMYRYVYSILETLIVNRLQTLMLMNRLFVLCGFYVFQKPLIWRRRHAYGIKKLLFGTRRDSSIYIATNFITPCRRPFAFTSNTGSHTRGKSNDLSGLQLFLFKHIFFRIK